jgi:uncharacterized repeat protein (TIGR04138 family)
LFWDAVDRIRESEPRYGREAFGFVVAALGVTVQALPPERLADPERRHLSGGELLQGLVRLARSEFGVLAPTVFREWGVLAGEDVGRIVFRLVECGELSARPEDSLEDFRGYDLMGGLTADLEVGAGWKREVRRPGPRRAAGG